MQERSALIRYGKSQIDYPLGAAYRSFVVGWGHNPPLRVRPPRRQRCMPGGGWGWARHGSPPGGAVQPRPLCHVATLVPPPLQPHHAAASCPSPPAGCSWAQFDAPGPNPQASTEGGRMGGCRDGVVGEWWLLSLSFGCRWAVELAPQGQAVVSGRRSRGRPGRQQWLWRDLRAACACVHPSPDPAPCPLPPAAAGACWRAGGRPCRPHG